MSNVDSDVLQGLQFVQTTMGVIQKLLGGIQASVARFDRKTT